MVHISARKPSIFVLEVPYFLNWLARILYGVGGYWVNGHEALWMERRCYGKTDVLDRNLFPCHCAHHKSNLGLVWAYVAWLTPTLELLLQPSYFSIILAIDVHIFWASSVFVWTVELNSKLDEGRKYRGGSGEWSGTINASSSEYIVYCKV
jgi:hypothetical protein